MKLATSSVSVLALDPGPTKSALVRWNGRSVTLERHAPNEEIAALLRELTAITADPLVIEQGACSSLALAITWLDTNPARSEGAAP
jgi:hypothetical protein